jgi:hypothetical protein
MATAPTKPTKNRPTFTITLRPESQRRRSHSNITSRAQGLTAQVRICAIEAHEAKEIQS